MATLLNTKSLSYKDVNLIATFPTKVRSRKEVPLEGERVVVSGMTSIVGPTFIKAWADLPDSIRPTLHVPRDIFQKENLALIDKLGLQSKTIVGVGLISSEEWIKELYLRGFENILIDVANGFLPQFKEVLSFWRKHHPRAFIIAGSVHSIEGAAYLEGLGVNLIRSGIAPGSVCITKDATGFTRGTFTEILEMSVVYNILADGGFSSPADLVKAFLAGASYCMTGSLFAEAKECRMHNEERGEFPKGAYFGMASPLGKKAMNKDLSHIEGTFKLITPTLSLKELVEGIWEGIRSGVSYSGYSSLSEAIGRGVFEAKF